MCSNADSSSTLLAKHHSQAGWLGMSWFQRLNQPGPHHISGADFACAVALHLSLPLAGFEGLSCTCGKALTAESGPLHIVSCNQFAKLPRSETFQHAFDSIMQEVCQDVRIEGAKPARGQKKNCAPYGQVPKIVGGVQPIDPATGQPALRDVVPDRIARNMRDHEVGLSGRYIIDTAIPAPEASSHVAAGATIPLSAAARTYAKKYSIYTALLQPHDVLLAVVCESWGGLHPGVLERLKKWAFFLGGHASRHDLLVAGDSHSSELLEIWRARLSCALLLGRVGLVSSALDRLAGVPARSSTFASHISSPFFRAQEFGRLRG